MRNGGWMSCCCIPLLWAAATGCGTLHVKAIDVRVLEEREEFVVVQLVTDQNVSVLNGSKWAAQVRLCYSVDDNKPVKVDEDAPNYDLTSITYTRPFGAQIVEEDAAFGRHFVSRWKLRREDKVDISPVVYAYSLRDGKEHMVTFEVYGASYSGGYLRSNPVTVKFPPRER